MSSSPQRAQSGTEVTGVNQVTHAIIGAAMKVHSALGPGLLESAYEACLVHELRKVGFKVEQQVELPVNYDGVQIDLGYRIDLVVNDCVIVELKCVEKIAPVHEAQLISYMRLSKKNVGLLINFHVRHLKDGIKRFVEGTDWN
jgi:GxxExxY protein